MSYPFNPDILTSYKVHDEYDDYVRKVYNRLEVLKQENGCYAQDVFYEDWILAKTIIDPSGLVKTISTFHDDMEFIRVFNVQGTIVEKLYHYKTKH